MERKDFSKPTPPETEPYAFADCHGRIMRADKRALTQSVRATNRYCIPLYRSDAVDAARVEGYAAGRAAAEREAQK